MSPTDSLIPDDDDLASGTHSELRRFEAVQQLISTFLRRPGSPDETEARLADLQEAELALARAEAAEKRRTHGTR